MDNVKNDEYYVRRIITDLMFIHANTQDVDEKELAANEILLDSMIFPLIQISENSKKLSEEYKEVHSEVPWVAMYGMRNRLVHDYGTVDLSIVFSTLKKDIPELLELMSEQLAE